MTVLNKAIIQQIEAVLKTKKPTISDVFKNAEFESARIYLLKTIQQHAFNDDLLEKAFIRFFKIRESIIPSAPDAATVIDIVRNILIKEKILILDRVTVEEKILGEMLKEIFKDQEKDNVTYDQEATTLSSLSSYYDFIDNDAQSIQFLFPHTSQNLKQQYAKMTLVEFATQTEAQELLLIFLQKDQNVLNSHNENNETPLHLAAKNGSKIAQFLLENGANPNVTDKAGNTPLSLAVTQGHYATVQLLVAINNINLSGKYFMSRNILFSALEKNWMDIAAIVIAKDPALINAGDLHQQTPLHIAAYKGDIQKVIFLIEAGANANCVDENKNTPLSLATNQKEDKGHTEIVRLLLKKMTPASINLLTQGKHTALQYAQIWEHQSMVQLFVSPQFVRETVILSGSLKTPPPEQGLGPKNMI